MSWRRALSWIVVLPTLMWTAIRLAGWDSWYPMAQFIAFTPYVAVLSLVPLAVTLLMRRWEAAIAAGLAIVLLAICVLPRWFTDRDALAGANGAELRVLTANVLAGHASAKDLTRIVREQRVDVLLVQELTPAFAEELGMVLPHRVIYPARGVGGSGIYSRTPLRDDGVRGDPDWFGQAKAELLETGIAIESVHTVAPSESSRMPGWRESFAHQPRATPDGPLRILAGDFNATLDHSVLRSLVSSGYRDAAATVGKGFTGTWGPYDGDRIPPVTLDRVLADRRIGIVDVHVFDLIGSDHRPLLAVLKLP